MIASGIFTSLLIGFKLSLFSSLFAFLSSFCLALLTDAKLLSLVSIWSLRARETVSFNSLFFVPDFVFFSLSLSPFNLLVALCSASFRLSKSLVIGCALEKKLFLVDVSFLKPCDCLNVPVLLLVNFP